MSVLCTYRKCARSTEFSAISCHAAGIGTTRVAVSLHCSGSENSSTSGTSHIGGSSKGWYQASTTPLRSMTGYVRRRAARLTRSL